MLWSVFYLLTTSSAQQCLLVSHQGTNTMSKLKKRTWNTSLSKSTLKQFSHHHNITGANQHYSVHLASTNVPLPPTLLCCGKSPSNGALSQHIHPPSAKNSAFFTVPSPCAWCCWCWCFGSRSALLLLYLGTSARMSSLSGDGTAFSIKYLLCTINCLSPQMIRKGKTLKK